ncbi:MAG: hypothetical protein M3N29_00830 [Chloroflexota bacterium]|nr:hypothetical protein [Chloroflexota bacterium]
MVERQEQLEAEARIAADVDHRRAQREKEARRRQPKPLFTKLEEGEWVAVYSEKPRWKPREVYVEGDPVEVE